MGLLDKFLSLFKGSKPEVASDPTGPLGILPGDVVSYYRETFTLRGMRVVEGEGGTFFHYCLETEDGQPVVIVASDAERPELCLQRAFTKRFDPASDRIAGPDDEEFVLESTTTWRVKCYGNAPGAGAKRVDVRTYREDEDDGVLVLEEYGSHREARVGVTVFEGEIVVGGAAHAPAQRSLSAAMASAEDDEGPPSDRMRKGSPLAAAMSLGETGTGLSIDGPAPDHKDPTAYDDDEWADADFDDDPPETISELASRKPRMAGALSTAQMKAEDTGNVWHGGHLGETGELGGTPEDEDDEWFDA